MGIMSMTGFGTGTATLDGRTYRVEVKSVNHKAFSARASLPPELSHAEVPAKNRVRDRLGRGAVDVIVRTERGPGAPPAIWIDHAAAAALSEALHELATTCGLPGPSLELLLRQGDVIRVEDPHVDPEAAQSAVFIALDQALDRLHAMRAAEGHALATDLLARLDALEAHVLAIEEASPAALAAAERRLRQRVADAQQALGLEVDEGRIAAELVVFADRADVTEETVRARTHLVRFRAELAHSDDAEPSGKRLDFLSQELLRELNTMGSKCRDADIAGRVIEAKVELEKIREQAQNIA